MSSKSTVTLAHEVNMNHLSTAAEQSTEKLLESNDSQNKRTANVWRNILENTGGRKTWMSQETKTNQHKYWNFFQILLQINKLCSTREEEKHISCSFFKQCIAKQLLDSVFVTSRTIKVLVSVISVSLQLRLTTLTSTLIILDITKTSSNNCLKFICSLKCANLWLKGLNKN